MTTNRDEWLERLGYAHASGLLAAGQPLGDRPYAAEIGDMFSPGIGIGASHVYCVDAVPVACFVDLTDAPAVALLAEVRARVWNQGLATVVIGLSPDRLAAYPVLHRDVGAVELAPGEARPNGPWSPHDFDTGAVHRRLPDWFAPERRVDQQLLENLTSLVQGLEPAIGARPAEALVAQTIFVRYLEDRAIVADPFRAKHQLRPLHDLVRERNGTALDGLIGKLGETFQGDFLRNTGFEPPSWASLPLEAFDLIDRFLAGEQIKEGQLGIWGYDFALIPVELISSIYESFLAERKRSRGAYYTPRNLATLTVEMAFEGGPPAHERRVFDGACGSGILLTSAFQKMLASAEAHAGRPLTFTERAALMQERIYGGDIDATACWITAFSLCLCLLARLTPADVVQLQEDEGTGLPGLIGTGGDANIRSGPDHGDFFSPDPAPSSTNWDVIVSNPPWREARGDPEQFEVETRNLVGDAPIPDRQIAAAYSYVAAARIAPGGTLALILPLNLMIGIDSAEFRRRFLELVRIERIVNFGDVRFLLFPMAKLSCAVVIARPRPLVEGPLFAAGELIEYWTPKADLAIALGCLVVTQGDRAAITPASVYGEPEILINRYWGRARDLAILHRLRRFGTLRTVADARGWAFSKGFHATDSVNGTLPMDAPRVQVLWDKPFLATRAVPKEHPTVTAEPALPLVRHCFKTVATPGGALGRLYSGNRVLWRNGLSSDRRFRAAYSDVPFAFQHTTCAVGGVEKDADLLKFLAVYLRSSLAAYIMVLTSFSVVGDRSAASKYETEKLPFAALDNHPDPAAARTAVRRAAAIVNRIAADPEHVRYFQYELFRTELDGLVADFFGLSEAERAIVAETAADVAPSLQPRGYSGLATALTDRPELKVAEQYAAKLQGVLATYREARGGSGGFKVTAELGNPGRVFGIARICTGSEDVSRAVQSADVDRLVADAMRPPRDGPHLRRMADVIIATGDCFHLVKPLQRRFWGARAAYEDADRIISAIDAAMAGRGATELEMPLG